ncbi:PilZ domain-containing protein [Butyrivibrio sp. VCD2006]|uniref:PilZ domain-containing protein n=1 Tax=Butyrivibrio sp. VCD2006 TaxID=1280664 RepID=UPI000427BBAE|nr:PilZ domain-containing protein [Butyrivibrio sp. VCD2006]
MNIISLAPGTKLSVSVLINNTPVVIKTRAITVLNGSLLVEPLKYMGRPIPAATQAAAMVSFANGEKKCFVLESLIPYTSWNDTYYLLKGTELITDEKNQRKAERFVINSLCKAVINRVTPTSAIIYDISVRGLSLILGKSATAKVGDNMTLAFKPAGQARTFEVNLTVVRNFKVGSYEAVGCKMLGIDSHFMNYILSVKKQKEEHRKAKAMPRVTVNNDSPKEIEKENVAKNKRASLLFK